MSDTYRLFDENLELFSSMLDDIDKAKRFICLEIYRFGIDSIGEKFRFALIKKAKEGVKVRVLIDAWGSGEDTSFYTPLQKAGIQLRVYRKLKIDRTYIIKNHCRNHRKLLIIDNNIGYIGSSNLTDYSLSWRDLNMRVKEEGLVRLLHHAFNDSFSTYDKYSISPQSYKRPLFYNSWLFFQDVPNPYRQKIK